MNTWQLQHDHHAKFSLIIKTNRIELKNNLEPRCKNIYLNFNYKKMQFYQKNKNLKIIQAIGIKKNYFPKILDVTAGLGKDAFIFFSLGCQVCMIERHPVLAALLHDSLIRGYKDKNIGNLLKKKITLIHDSSINILSIRKIQTDVIYLDPMFPNIKNYSLSKKNIRTVRSIVGQDHDSTILLQQCRSYMVKKVVVKRPKNANYLGNNKPNYVIKTKKNRFDIYINTNKNISQKIN